MMLCDCNDYTHKPRIITTHNIASFMASTTQALIAEFHWIETQLPLICVVNIMRNSDVYE